MKAVADLSKAPAHETTAPPSRLMKQLRWMIWLYLILLVIEGALRKWVVPQLSNPLLIVRDPVVIAIYVLALRARLFPRNAYIVTLAIITVLAFAVGLLVLLPYLPIVPVLLVTLYGVRSDFLHLPLIFVLAKVLNAEDVKRIGWWTLIGMIPMAGLMVAQFTASPESFINRTAGLGEGMQITAGGGRIRPPGTFSFVTGTVFYVAAATAFLLKGAISISEAAYRNWLLFAGGFAVMVAVVVSGSRSLVGSVVVVTLSLGVILLVRPNAVNKFGRNLLIVVVAGLLITRLPIFSAGMDVLTERFDTAESSGAEITKGLAERILSGFTEPLQMIDRIPLGGYGLGIGTNGGAKFLVGRAGFLLAEGEWARVLLENGPFLGLAFLLWRTVLAFDLGYRSLVALRGGEVLPILLFSSGFLVLLNGQFGQPTSLGFAVVLNGLCLAAMRPAGAESESPEALAAAAELARKRRIPRRSPYAERLHSSGNDPTNGSAAQ